jgi:hypothetical protein
LKDYIETEDGVALVRDSIARAARIATSAITYVQVRSALARRRRARDLSSADYRDAVGQFEDAWGRYVRIDVTDGVLAEAARVRASAGRAALSGRSSSTRAPWVFAPASTWTRRCRSRPHLRTTRSSARNRLET